MDGEYETSIQISEKVVLININRLFQDNLTQDGLYEITRGIWRLNPERAKNAKYAFAVYQGVIVETFLIHYWVEAGTTEYAWRKFTESEKENRYEFEGEIAEDQIREKYLNKNVRDYLPHGAQNPIRFVNI
jgi:hypothetical protein